MQAPRHRRLVPLILVVPALLFLSASEGWARQPQGVWQLLDNGIGANKPPVRKHSTLVYDPGMKRLIMFGGDKSPSGAYSDVWAYPLPCGPWVQLFADNATDCTSTARPCRRHGHVATYVPGSTPKMVIHGGKGESGTLINDTWQLTLGTTPAWTRLWYSTTPSPSTPLPRWHHAMVCYGSTPRFFAGGIIGAIGMCDTWSFNGSSWNWISGNKTGSGPCGSGIPGRRYQHSLVLDTANNEILTLGGLYEGEVGVSEVWKSASAGSSWTLVGLVPDGYSRYLHTATYDPIGQRMIVIGGYAQDYNEGIVSAVTSMSTAWQTYGAWSTLSPAGTGPGAISEHAAAYDSDDDRIIVFGGVDQSGAFQNDLWALQFADDAIPPAAVTNLTWTGVTTSSATVRWAAPGDDCTAGGNASSFDVRYSLSEITDDASFAAATQATGEPAPAAPGTLQSVTIGGLASGSTYWIAMKTSDESANVSALSNVISVCIPYIPNTLCAEFQAPPPDEGAGLQVAFGIRDLGPQQAGSPVAVRFGLARPGPVTLEMFDVVGRRIARADLGDPGPGEHSRSLDAKSRLAAGIYLVRLSQGSSVSTQRVVLLQP